MEETQRKIDIMEINVYANKTTVAHNCHGERGELVDKEESSRRKEKGESPRERGKPAEKGGRPGRKKKD